MPQDLIFQPIAKWSYFEPMVKMGQILMYHNSKTKHAIVLKFSGVCFSH